MRTADFVTKTKRMTLNRATHRKEEIFSVASVLFEEENQVDRGIRLLGVTVTGLNPLTYENIELPLWQTNVSD